ncbi:MAG: hypothetical protein R3E86_03585 [Pseudomonadales bacterium]
MNLQKYALIAEIVGAIAVVISLAYVGVGVRQNTEAVQVANHQALVAMDMEKNAWLRDADFAAAYQLANDDPAQLSPARALQVRTYVADTLNAWEFAFITFRGGAMDETIWNGWDGFYRSQLATRPFQWFWHEYGANFSPAFRAYVAAVLDDADSGS